MTFLQPFILWGLPAALLPLVIHLLNRMRYRSVHWAAMSFLISANRASTRHAKLRQILILCCRVLALLLLVLFVARRLAGLDAFARAGHGSHPAGSFGQHGAGGRRDRDNPEEGGVEAAGRRRQGLRPDEPVCSLRERLAQAGGPERRGSPAGVAQRRADGYACGYARAGAGGGGLAGREQIRIDRDMDSLRLAPRRVAAGKRALAGARRAAGARSAGEAAGHEPARASE